MDDALEFKNPGTQSRNYPCPEAALLREEREVITAYGAFFTIPRTRITVTGTEAARYYEGSSTDGAVAVTVHISMFPSPQTVVSVYWQVHGEQRLVTVRQPNQLIVEGLEKAFLLQRSQEILDANYNAATQMTSSPLVLRAFHDSQANRLKVSISTQDRRVHLVAAKERQLIDLRIVTASHAQGEDENALSKTIRAELCFIAPIIEQALSVDS